MTHTSAKRRHVGRGEALARTSLFALALLATLTTCQRGESPPARRLLILGWDGASFRMMDPLLEKGHLPNVAELLARGQSARLQSTIVPISSAAWTSAVTGKTPGQTGVYDFFESNRGSNELHLVSSLSNHATPLWRLLTQRGRRSIVFGVPVTYPPEPIFGVMVAGMLSPFDAEYTYPPAFSDELRSRGFEPDLDVWREFRSVDRSHIRRQLKLKQEILIELLDEEPWDFAMLVFKSLDVISHGSYKNDFSKRVNLAYEWLDDILGAVLEVVEREKTDILLMSDHGFHEYRWGFNLYSWLVQRGYTTPRSDGNQVERPPGMPLEQTAKLAIENLRSRIQWERTVAFPTSRQGNCGTLRLNLSGREPLGTVLPEEVDSLLERLTNDLLSITMDGETPLVRQVLRGADHYPGPWSDQIPDLLFEVDEDWLVTTDTQRLAIMGRFHAPIPDHDRSGIFIAAGPSIASDNERGAIRVEDIAPTALHLLGEPVYEGLAGNVYLPLLRRRSTPQWTQEPRNFSSEAAAGSELFQTHELGELETRLRSLGYTK